MKNIQTILLSITIALLIYIAFGIGRADKPETNNARLDKLYKVTYTLAMNTEKLTERLQELKKTDTITVHHWHTAVKEVLVYDIPKYTLLYDSITGSPCINFGDTLTAFDKEQLDTITTKIYMGEMNKALLDNCRVQNMTYDTVFLTQDSTITTQWQIIQEYEDSAVEVKKKARNGKFTVGGVAAFIGYLLGKIF